MATDDDEQQPQLKRQPSVRQPVASSRSSTHQPTRSQDLARRPVADDRPRAAETRQRTSVLPSPEAQQPASHDWDAAACYAPAREQQPPVHAPPPPPPCPQKVGIDEAERYPGDSASPTAGRGHESARQRLVSAMRMGGQG